MFILKIIIKIQLLFSFFLLTYIVIISLRYICFFPEQKSLDLHLFYASPLILLYNTKAEKLNIFLGIKSRVLNLYDRYQSIGERFVNLLKSRGWEGILNPEDSELFEDLLDIVAQKNRVPELTGQDLAGIGLEALDALKDIELLLISLENTTSEIPNEACILDILYELNDVSVDIELLLTGLDYVHGQYSEAGVFLSAIENVSLEVLSLYTVCICIIILYVFYKLFCGGKK